MDLRVACGQINPIVGDIDGNAGRIADAMRWAAEVDADVLLLPELAVTGYPPEDLVLRDDFVDANLLALDRLAKLSGRTAVVVGFVDRVPGDSNLEDSRPRHLANAAAILAGGEVRGVYHKLLLPNYGVFDESRYFAAGRHTERLWRIAGVPVGVSVCEDIWLADGPPARQAASGARILLNINGSPYHLGKTSERLEMLRTEAVRDGMPLVYLNMVGGQDELVFDGGSMVIAADGAVLHRAPTFEESLFVVDVPVDDPGEDTPDGTSPVAEAVEVSPPRRGDPPRVAGPEVAPVEPVEAEVYAALVTGLRDYVHKNGFTEVVVGLSGGIDSALTCAIAVDALGPEAVWGVTMPTRYSSEGSWADSEHLARNLGCRFDVVPVDDVFARYLDALDPVFGAAPSGRAEENLQARIRGDILMALSNKHGGMVVATGNKSEMAVGYATLYGDMVGGYAVLKDVFKTLVYRLARWRNDRGDVIPTAIIDKPPSAELRPGQLDTDSLPEYDVLDGILERYVEEDASITSIVSDGFDGDMVRSVARMVDRNEYKRRQAAPGVRITTKAFGKDRRLPITNRFDPRRMDTRIPAPAK